MAINSISFPTPQAYSGGVDFSSLANLGNVYRQGQEDAAKRLALSKLGDDPTANASILTSSGVPSLAQLGINMQQHQGTEAERVREWEAANSRAEAIARRAEEDYKKKGEDEEAARASVAALWGNRGAPPPSPDVFTRGAPPVPFQPPAPQAAPLPAPQPMPPVQGMGENNEGLAVPLAPGQMPPNAPGTPAVPLPAQAAPPAPAPPPEIPPSPIAPSSLQATGALTAAPPAQRVASTLATGGNPASAGISREQIGEMYRNPETRDLAKVFLQNAMNPGTWKIEKTEDGRLVAVNDKTLESKDVTPPTPGGGPPGSKEERETEGFYRAGIKLGMSDAQARAFAGNKGKMPGLSSKAQTTLLANEAAIPQAQDVIDNIDALSKLSPDATSGTFGQLENKYLGGLGSWTPDAVKKSQQMSQLATMNVLQQVRTLFPGRVLAAEFKTLQTLEHPEQYSDEVRQQSYATLKKLAQDRLSEMKRENEGIRSGAIFEPGFNQSKPTPAPTPAPTGAKPTLGEFMTKARDANPGTSDSELARYWKDHYGS
jgi:hypothetical protein